MPAVSLRKRLHCRCFPLKFVKFFRAAFLYSTSRGLILIAHSIKLCLADITEVFFILIRSRASSILENELFPYIRITCISSCVALLLDWLRCFAYLVEMNINRVREIGYQDFNWFLIKNIKVGVATAENLAKSIKWFCWYSSSLLF